jgi:hypothetical protein
VVATVVAVGVGVVVTVPPPVAIPCVNTVVVDGEAVVVVQWHGSLALQSILGEIVIHAIYVRPGRAEEQTIFSRLSRR